MNDYEEDFALLPVDFGSDCDTSLDEMFADYRIGFYEPIMAEPTYGGMRVVLDQDSILDLPITYEGFLEGLSDESWREEEV